MYYCPREASMKFVMLTSEAIHWHYASLWFSLLKLCREPAERRQRDGRETVERQQRDGREHKPHESTDTNSNDLIDLHELTQQTACVFMLFVVSICTNLSISIRSNCLFVWSDLLRCVFVHCVGTRVCVWLCVQASQPTHWTHTHTQRRKLNHTNKRIDRCEFQWFNRFT